MKVPGEEARVVSPGNTTYYVDPIHGSDENCGTDESRPWRTFIPINRLSFAPGDSVNVIAPGRFHETLCIAGEGTAESSVAVHLAPGRYDFHPDNAIRRLYNISNTNDGTSIPKAIALLFDRAKHVRVTGPGAEIMLRGKMIEICVDSSEDIEVSGLTFDYKRPTVSEWKVVSTTDEYADLEIHRDSYYTLDDGRITWQGEGWSYETGLAQELVPETHMVDRMKNPLAEMRIEDRGPFKVRAHGQHKMRPGTIFQLRDTFRDCVGVFMRRSKRVTFRELNFRFMHGMGILCQFTEDITLDRVCIAPDEKSGRTTAAWADCTHLSGCRGRLVVKDCLFCGAHDDAMNVHGTYLRIVEQPAEDQLKLRFMHKQTYGFMAFNMGDEIDLVRWDTLDVFGNSRVKEVEMLDERELLVTLDKPVASDWNANDVVENVTWTPEVEISGCKSMRIPSRGFLLSTRRKVMVTDSEFVSLRNGIHCGGEASKWFESGPVHDMTIRGNRFINGKGPAIHIVPECNAPNSSINSNVTIADNEFVDGTGPAVQAVGTTGLTIKDNTLKSRELVEASEAFTIENCEDVTVEGNEFEVQACDACPAREYARPPDLQSTPVNGMEGERTREPGRRPVYPTPGSADRPNILFIMTDQESTATAGCYGHPLIKTPARDSIAAKGMRFDNHYIASFPCTPSRGTMITGMWAHNHGCVTNGVVLDYKHDTFGSQLEEAGYDTIWIGKHHLGGWFEPQGEQTCPYHELFETEMGYDWKKHPGGGGGEDYNLRGFQKTISGWTDYRAYLQTTDLPDEIKQDRWVGGHQVAQSGPDSEHSYSRLTSKHHMEGWMAGEAVKELGRLKDSQKPFCMVLSFYGPHHPCAPPKPYDEMYDLKDIELPDSFNAPQDKKNAPPRSKWGLTNNVRENWTEEQCKDYIRRYLGCVTYIDDQMMLVLDALKNNGLEDNTIIVFSSDHGEMLCEQGLIYKHVFNGYDALMKVPLLVYWPGNIPAGSVHSGLTTHLDLVPTLLDLAGVDISDQVDGQSMAEVLKGNASVAREEIFCDAHNSGYMMRRGQWKFVLNATVLKGKFVRKLDELYDMENDPNEITNLAFEDEHGERVMEMKERILCWLKESGHPYADRIREAAEVASQGN